MQKVSYLNLYGKILEHVFTVHDASEYGNERHHAKHRAFLLFKLTIFMDVVRGHNSTSQLFSVKDSVIAYISNKTNQSPKSISEYSTHELILTLLEDIKAFKLPSEIRESIANEYPIGADDLRSEFDTNQNLGSFKEGEWQFELLKDMKLKSRYL